MSIQREIVDGLPNDTAIVSDSPESFLADTTHPLSMTPQGRLRVSMVSSDIESVWINTFNNPWASCINLWEMESSYV